MKTLLTAALLLCLSGCGQKGPLYFAPKPEATPAPQANAPAATSQQDKDDSEQKDKTDNQQ